MLISCIPSPRSVMATSRRSRSTAKSLKHMTKMIVEGVDGVHTMDFSSFECSASFVK